MPFTKLLKTKHSDCKNKEIERRLQTDGTQAIILYIDIVTLKLRESRVKTEERKEKDEIRMRKLI